MIAKLPEALVKDALETAPKEFTLCARDLEHDLLFPSHPYPYATTSGLAVNVVDRHTGEYRPSTKKDAAEFAKLGDAIDSVDFLWTSLTATDVSALAHGPHELWATMQNTSQHVQGVTVQSAEDARVQIELAALIAGGSDALRERPLMSVISCPIAPLSFEEGAIEAQVEFARAGIPICSMSMSMSGITSPVTVAGTITNANAENLAALVVYYLTFKRWPPLDRYKRPLFAYGKTIHDNCERRAHFDAGQYVENWGDEGHRTGYCLYRMGCKGPVAF